MNRGFIRYWCEEASGENEFLSVGNSAVQEERDFGGKRLYGVYRK
jgi:hypothetical protein